MSIFKQFGLVAIALLLGVAFSSCGENPFSGSSQSNGSLPSSNAEKPVTEINMAMIPWVSSEKQNEDIQQLEEYLTKTLSLPVKITLTKSYQASIDLLVEEKVEIAYLGPFSYIKAKERNPNLEPLVAHIEKSTARPWYSSVIIANTTAGINNLEDLKGKRFGFVSKSSTSGFLVASAQFKEMKIEPERDFAAVEYAGGHDKNLEALIAGTVDASAVNKITYLQFFDQGKLPEDQYKLIWESNPIPNSPIVISSQLPSQLKSKLQIAFINAPEGLVNVGGVRASGYTSVRDEDYDLIRKIQKNLEK
jgi:phosphonate transport system substrate-binding protein